MAKALNTIQLRKGVRNLRGRSLYQPATTVQVKQKTFSPAGLYVKAGVRGTKLYSVQVLFMRLKEAQPGSEYVTALNKKGKKVKVAKPTPHTNVQVRCSCEDFQFTWSEHLRKNDALYGKPFTFPPRVGTGKPRNPKRFTGMCKHINSVMHVILD